MNTIKICDRTVKHVLSGDYSLSFKEKIEVTKLLDMLNVDVIELDEIRNKKVDSLLIKSIVTAVKNSTIAVPVPLDSDPKDVVDVLTETTNYRLQIEAPVSSVRMEYLEHKKPAMIKEAVENTIKACKEYTDNIEFIADDASRSDRDFLYEIINTVIDLGVKTVTLSDDAGAMLPNEFVAFIDEVVENVPKLKDVNLGVNCSNEIAMADASVVEALCHGVKEVKVCAYGSDYASLANVAKAIAGKGEVFDVTTNVNITKIKRNVAQIARLCADDTASNSPFSSIIDSDTEIKQLNKNDDYETVVKAVEELGYDLSEEDCQNVFDAFMELAKKKEYVDSVELDAIVASSAMQVPFTYKLDNFVVSTGKGTAAMVHMSIEHNGEVKEGVSLGDGPIDASFLAIEQITGRHIELDDFQIKAVTQGKEAAGEAIVKLRAGGKLYSGRGLSTDIIGSSISAYLNALNKLVYEEE